MADRMKAIVAGLSLFCVSVALIGCGSGEPAPGPTNYKPTKHDGPPPMKGNLGGAEAAPAAPTTAGKAPVTK